MPETSAIYYCEVKVLSPVGNIEKAGTCEGEDSANALANFIRKHFRNPDGTPVKRLKFSEITVEAVQ